MVENSTNLGVGGLQWHTDDHYVFFCGVLAEDLSERGCAFDLEVVRNNPDLYRAERESALREEDHKTETVTDAETYNEASKQSAFLNCQGWGIDA